MVFIYTCASLYQKEYGYNILSIKEFPFQASNFFSTHRKRNCQNHRRGYLLSDPQKSLNHFFWMLYHTKILGAITNTKFLMFQIMLNCIQFKLFIMLLCHHKILLRYDASISYNIYWKFSHFDSHILVPFIPKVSVPCRGLIHLNPFSTIPFSMRFPNSLCVGKIFQMNIHYFSPPKLLQTLFLSGTAKNLPL